MRVWNLKSVHGARRTKQSLSYKKFTNLISLAGPIKENNCYILLRLSGVNRFRQVVETDRNVARAELQDVTGSYSELELWMGFE